jgi:alkylation response protein AidB-like acyl-CoA dehydrogenase
MRLRDSASDAIFRRELGLWLTDAVRAQGELPRRAGMRERREYDARWQRRLFDAGYAGLAWPTEYGGRGASLSQQLIFHEECARAAAPWNTSGFVGLQHGGPTLIAEGNAEQKARHLPFILRGEQVWCQCFSEPAAGSDLAGLRTRAVRDGDHYTVNGHKIWTSMAQVADYAELLVRTDPDAPKHRGVTWLILPMDSPGIEVRPLRTLLGSEEFSEVFLNDVRVPVSQRVGAENDGWRVTNVTLRFERGTAFAGQMIGMQRALAELARLCGIERAERRELGHLAGELDALLAMLRLTIAQAEKTGVPGLASSALKLCFSELWQRSAEFGMRLAGRAGLSLEDVAGFPSQRLAFAGLGSLQATIAAGTSQIQRNIIAERILGQPK